MPDLFDIDDLWPHGYDRVLELATKGDVGRVLDGQAKKTGDSGPNGTGGQAPTDLSSSSAGQ